MTLLNLFRSQSVNDPVLGALARSRGYWRGRLTLGSHHDVPLLLAGGRPQPDDGAIALAQELPARYPALQGAIGTALFAHYEPYQDAIDAGEIETDEPFTRLASAADVWPHVTPVHILIEPLQGRLAVEIGYATAWDIEHILGARLIDWALVELNGSVLPPR